MSTLPNAPLNEVIFELRWPVRSEEDLKNIQYLYGDMYSQLKDSYPHRESVLPWDVPMIMTINQPVHRYRASDNGYPLVQIGPGILTFNTDNSNYKSIDFIQESSRIVDIFLNNYKLDSEVLSTPSLAYIDFYPFNFHEGDVNEFIDTYFNLEHKQHFFKEKKSHPIDVHLWFYYSINSWNLSVAFRKWVNLKWQEGILVQTKIDGVWVKTYQEILGWTKESHLICRSIFEKLTEWDLYNSFK